MTDIPLPSRPRKAKPSDKRDAAMKARVWQLLTQTPVDSARIQGGRVVLPRNDGSSVYALEYMIAETMASFDPCRTWAVTGVGPDGGIDFEAHGPSTEIKVLDLKFEPYVVGQVKRMKTYEESKVASIFSKFHEISRARNIHFVIVVISTETVDSDQCRSIIESKEKYSYFQCPRHYADVEKFLDYWIENVSFLKRMLDQLFNEENAALIGEYVLGRRSQTRPLRIEAKPDSDEVTQKVPFQVTVRFQFERLLSLQTLELRHEAASDTAPGMVRLPSTAGAGNRPLRMVFRDADSAVVRLWFRADRAGSFPLGRLVAWEAGRPDQTVGVDLGMVTVAPHLEFGYLREFQDAAAARLDRRRMAAAGGRAVAVLVTGAAGSGKSALCRNEMDHAVEDGFRQASVELFDTSDMSAGLRELIQALYGHHADLGMPTTADIIAAVRPWLGERPDVLAQLEACLTPGGTDLRLRDVAVGVCALALRAVQDQPLVLHVSGLQWASRDVLYVLRLLVEGLKEAESTRFGRGALFLFEGRTGEARRVDGGQSNIQPWLDFVQSQGSCRVDLKPWSAEVSRAFVKAILGGMTDGSALGEVLADHLQERGCGSPLHILEQIRLLMEDGTLRLAPDGSLDVVGGLRRDHSVPPDIDEVIRDRYRYLRHRSAELADLLVLLARTGRRADRTYVEQLMAAASSPFNAADLEETGLIRAPAGTQSYFEFIHQTYVDVLRGFGIAGGSPMLKQAVAWHEALTPRSVEGVLTLATLQYLLCPPPFSGIIAALTGVLTAAREVRDGAAMAKILRNLLRAPRDILAAEGLDPDGLRFELALVLAGTAGWPQSLTELDGLLADCRNRPGDRQAQLWAVEALAEKANLYADLQRPAEAVASVEDGLRRLSLIRNRGTDGAEVARIERLEDKLLHRKAVALWFDGRRSEALALHRWVWRRTRGRRDDASLAVVLREIGTLLLHSRQSRGAALLRVALDLSESEPEVSRLDRSVTAVQEVMGRLVLAERVGAGPADFAGLALEAMDLRDVCLSQGMGYESALAALVAGAATASAGNFDRAHTLFRLAVIEATQAQLPNIMWQSRLNLAQVCRRLEKDEEARTHARGAAEIILAGLSDGSDSRKQLMEQPLEMAARCGSGIHQPGADAASPELVPLHCRAGDDTYYLMN